MERTPCILTIAGSDSGGGAGIQADLKTMTMLGGYGMSVLTALTAQNGLGVTGIHPVDPAFVAQQLTTVLEGFDVSAAKTGMLFSAEIIDALAQVLEQKTFPLVVDPVCVSQSGHQLLQDDAVEALKSELLPLADLLTPNRPEAELLTGRRIESEEDLFAALDALLTMGPRAVLLKGGHALREDGEESVDWLAFPGQKPMAMPMPIVRTKNTHGTGCTLSAAIATGLGQGLGLVEAVRQAQEYLNLGLRAAYNPGLGTGPVNHAAPLAQLRGRLEVLDRLEAAGRRLEAMPGLARLIPEVRLNLALAAPWPRGIQDVAAFAGRVTCSRDGKVYVVGAPAFAASSHMAKVVLAAHRASDTFLAAVNIRYSEAVLQALDKAGMNMAWFDRADEPKEVKEREGSSLEWGTSHALSLAARPETVDAVCDPGETGKEPIVRLLGRDEEDLLSKLERVLEQLSSEQ